MADRDALPDTPDPIDIAMAELSGDPALDNPARTLLIEQVGLVRAQNRQLGRQRWRDVIITLLGLIFLMIVLSFIWSAARAKSVVVEPFDTPPQLRERGLTPQVLAASIQDSIKVIQELNTRAALQRNIDNAWTNDIDAEVPNTGVSVGELDRLLRARLGNQTHVQGSLVRNPDATVSLTIRATGVQSRTFTGPEVSLPQLTSSAAEYVYGQFEPRLFSRYLTGTGRADEAITFLETAYPRAPESYRSELASSWATALATKGRMAEAVEKGRLAVELDPLNWIAWSNLIGNLYDTEGQEGAARAGRLLERRIELTPSSERSGPELNVLQNYRPLVQDWVGLRDATLRSLDATGGRGALATGNVSASLAETFGQMHDWRGANRALASSPPGNDRDAAILIVHAFRRLEARDYEGARSVLQRFHRLWESDEDVHFTYPFGPCYLAFATSMAGDRAAGDALFAGTGRWVECYTFRAHTIEATGDRRRADAAYARAIRLAPSLPFAYHHYGRALLARGDTARARTAFEAAHRHGPKWADPLKALGDMAAAQGEWKRALAYYEQATPLAPGWRELAQVRQTATAKVATLPWWQRIFG
jgi:tetratricopeptide (TPR) repeat protein